MIGQKFGKLTVTGEAEKQGSTGHRYWTCLCECGKTKDIRSSSLRTGHEKSCGCMKTAFSNRKKTDRSGVRFGRLVTLERAMTPSGIGGYKCKCDCGNEVVVRTGLLVSGNTKSCGCGQSVKPA